jgi:hypothetical protein
METINIINNFNSKILMENLLITNHLKLLDSIIKIFESGYLSNTDIDLNIENVKNNLDKQKFINWELFINLINLDSTFYSHKTNSKTNSLNYIVKCKSMRMIEFLLYLTLENYKTGFIEEQINWSDVFVDIIKQLYLNDTIINKLIDLILIDSQYKELLNKQINGNKTSLFYLISKCSESVILRLIETNLVNWDWGDDYSNTLVHWACKRNLTQIFDLAIENNTDLNKLNKGGKTPIHLTCIKNNILLTKLLINNKVDLETIDLESNAPINYAIKYGKSKLVKLLLDENITIRTNNTELFYQIIKYHDEELVSYFIDKNVININKTSWLWTTLLFGYKSMYSQIITYSTKKLFVSIIDYYTNMDKYYDGHYIGDMFYDHDDINTYYHY